MFRCDPRTGGNIIALASVDGTPQIVGRYEYGPFGEPLRVTGAAAGKCPFRFSSKYTDEETGLVYYGYRYYNPVLGRWLNRDPIPDPRTGPNVAAFVGNGPVNSVDVLGLYAVGPPFGPAPGVPSVGRPPDRYGFEFFWKWLVDSSGQTLVVGWDVFDPYGTDRRILADAWLDKNRSLLEAACIRARPGFSAQYVLDRKVVGGFSSEVQWIGDYEGTAKGQSGGLLLAISHEAKECRCRFDYTLVLEADYDNDATFNSGGRFGDYGMFRDDWFLLLQRHTPLGHDYEIYAYEERQVDNMQYNYKDGAWAQP